MCTPEHLTLVDDSKHLLNLFPIILLQKFTNARVYKHPRENRAFMSRAMSGGAERRFRKDKAGSLRLCVYGCKTRGALLRDLGSVNEHKN